jgi:hypothetical protein
VFLSKCRCCGTCNCPPYGHKDNFTPWTDGYSPCCGETCMPCSLTMTLTPGTEWFGQHSNLTAAQKEQIRAALSRAFVVPLYEKSNDTTDLAYRSIVYWYFDSPLYPRWRAKLSMQCSCQGSWSIGDNGVFADFSSDPLPIAGGPVLVELFFPAVFGTNQFGNNPSTCPFTGNDWCGLSSFDTTITLPPHTSLQSIFIRPQRIAYRLPQGDSPTTTYFANLRGSTLRYQW